MQKLVDTLGNIEALSVQGALSIALDDENGCGDIRASDQRVPDKISISARCDSWSRRARRRPKQFTGEADDEVTMACSISFVCESDENRTSTAEFKFRWLYGWERALFESFASHVMAKVIK